MTPIQRQNLLNWIAALRSGECTQCRGKLHRIEEWNGFAPGYCCLGVFSKLQGVEEKESKYYSYFHFSSNLTNITGHIPLRIFEEWTGLPGNFADKLTIANDHGNSFEEIADMIEQEMRK